MVHQKEYKQENMHQKKNSCDFMINFQISGIQILTKLIL